MQYLQDYDNFLIPYSYITAADNKRHNWEDGLQPYTKSQQVFLCPDDINTRNAFYGNVSYPSSYGINLFVSGTSGWSTDYPIIASTKVVNSAGTVLIADSGGWPMSTNTNNGGGACGTLDPATWPDKAQLPGSVGTSDQLTADLIVDNLENNLVGGSFLGQCCGNNGNMVAAPEARHLGTSNVLWFDGHVKALHIEKFYTCASSNPCMLPAQGCS